MARLLKQSSTTQPLLFLLIDSSDHLTGKTGLSPTVKLGKSGGTGASPSGSISEIDATNLPGWYQVAGNATDTNTLGPLILHASASGADPSDTEFEIIAPDLQSATNLGLSALPTASPAATGGLPTVNSSNYIAGLAGSLNTLDALATHGDSAWATSGGGADPRIADSGTAQAATAVTLTLKSGTTLTDLAGWYLQTTGGTAPNQIRAVLAYDAGSKVASVRKWTTTPDNTTTYNLLYADAVAPLYYNPYALDYSGGGNSAAQILLGLDASSSAWSAMNLQRQVTNADFAATTTEFETPDVYSTSAWVADLVGRPVFIEAGANVQYQWSIVTAVAAGGGGKLHVTISPALTHILGDGNAVIFAANAAGGSAPTTDDIAAAIWSAATRTLTSFGTLAADVWTSGTRTLSAFTFLTSGGIADAVWDEAAADHVGTGTTGLALQSGGGGGDCDCPTAAEIAALILLTPANKLGTDSAGRVTISGTKNTLDALNDVTAAAAATAVWAEGTRTLTSFGTLAADVWTSDTRTLSAFTFLTSGGIADAVWDEGVAGHDLADTFGGLVQDRLNLITISAVNVIAAPAVDSAGGLTIYKGSAYSEALQNSIAFTFDALIYDLTRTGITVKLILKRQAGIANTGEPTITFTGAVGGGATGVDRIYFELTGDDTGELSLNSADAQLYPHLINLLAYQYTLVMSLDGENCGAIASGYVSVLDGGGCGT